MNDENKTRLELVSADDCRSAALQLVTTTRRSLALFTRDLEPAIFGTVEFATALQRLALRSRFSHIRIVVIDPATAIRDGHRLVALARRLTSFIEFRRPGPDHANLAETFLVTDETGVLYRPLSSRYEGFSDTDNGFEARRYLKRFSEIWSQAEPEQEFRRLGL
ncbi:MAG TPA: acyltransferase [Gammaproteobacteria bacterium]|jgi:hypothetical protein|nr:acyltransferase [Gammaproteobacteria bacterium]